MRKRSLKKIEASLRKYVYMTVRLHNTSSSRISRQLGRHRSYVNSLMGGRSQSRLIELAPKIAKYVNAPENDILSITKGNFKPVHKLASHYVKSYVNQSYNYFWILCHRYHMSNAKLAKKLHVQYDDVCWIQRSTHPQVHTIIDIAKVFKLSPYNLGKKFGYKKSTVKQAVENKHIKYNFGRYVYQLRLKRHWSQSYVAKKTHMRQSNVSRIEKSPSSQLKTLLLVTRLFNVPLLNMAHHHFAYHSMQSNSPTYKILNLCLKRNISLSLLSKKINSPHLPSILLHKQHNTDELDDNIAKPLIKFFDLPQHYFGETSNSFKRAMKGYKRRTTLKPSDFGYRLQVLRCKHHMTLANLGERMGVTNSRTQQLVYTKSPSRRIIAQVKDIFHIKKI